MPAYVPYQTQTQVYPPISPSSPYSNINPYNPYSSPNANLTNNTYNVNHQTMNTNTAIETLKLQDTFHRLIGRSYKQILPEPFKSEYNRFNIARVSSNVAFFIFFIAKSFELQRLGGKLTLRRAARWMLGYIALNFFFEIISAKYTTRYYDQMFKGMSNQQIEQQLADFKQNTVVLRY
jgi:hypothetical protein